ncbi:amidophosphoribosyltransferase [Limoniibacter endophyticus]|uniref:Amidophosphoribosyltransferase n=1 Tax=Limoniibacter endophyticus TaxID=1565040 RepID=A0A8J3DKE1_9HYPH|nr:amidophosphoribosyltransferase [Limoniibacter endophyticus]
MLGTPFEFDMGEGAISPAAIANPPDFDRARSAVYYSGPARDMIRGLKYHDRTDLAPWLANWMLRPGEELLIDADHVVPVPLHWHRFVSRRFNQSAELARHVSRLSKVPLTTGLLARRKSTSPQVGLTAQQRKDNVSGAFQVKGKGKALVAGKKILLIDDVFTTGATVSACARVLKRHGAARVDVLTFARVMGDDFAAQETDAI